MLEVHIQLRIAVCDDNPEDLATLLQMFHRVMERLKLNFSITSFSSSAELVEYVQQHGPAAFDLFLLDIFLDEKNGVDLAGFLRENGSRAALIFVTCTPDFALDSYKVSADDYLLKPVTEDVLYASLKRISVQRSITLITSGGVSQVLQLDDVLFAEAVGHYMLIHTLQRPEPIRIRASLPLLLDQLGKQRFARCHKGYLVALGQIFQINTSSILLRSGQRVPLGRSYRESMREALVQYVEQCLPTIG